MTKREAAVLQAYTGFKMLEGFDQGKRKIIRRIVLP